MSLLPKDLRYPGTRVKKAEDYSEAIGDITNEGITFNHRATDEDGTFIGACTSIGLKWPSYSYITL